MAKEDRFYAFIIAHTSRSRARVQRIRVEKRFVTIPLRRSAGAGRRTVYGLYGLTQHASHLRIEFENQRLRAENERQRQELEKLNNRVEKVEDTSRKLAEKSGVVEQPNPPTGARRCLWTRWASRRSPRRWAGLRKIYALRGDSAPTRLHLPCGR